MTVLDLSEGPAKPRNGLMRCPRCGKSVRLKRLRPHDETPECMIRVTIQAYAERGWIQCENKVQAQLLGECGGEVEMGPGRIDLQRATTTAPDGAEVSCFARDKDGRLIEITTDRAYAPKWQVRACQLISGISFERGLRRRVLSLLLSDEQVREATTAVSAIAKSDGLDVGAAVREFLKKLLYDRQLRSELTNWDPDEEWLAGGTNSE